MDLQAQISNAQGKAQAFLETDSADHQIGPAGGGIHRLPQLLGNLLEDFLLDDGDLSFPSLIGVSFQAPVPDRPGSGNRVHGTPDSPFDPDGFQYSRFVAHQERSISRQAEVMKVECYEGHTGQQRPVRFWVEGRRIEIVEIVDQWREPDARCFRVRTDDGRSWTLSRQGEHWSVMLLLKSLSPGREGQS